MPLWEAAAASACAAFSQRIYNWRSVLQEDDRKRAHHTASLWHVQIKWHMSFLLPPKRTLERRRRRKKLAWESDTLSQKEKWLTIWLRRRQNASGKISMPHLKRAAERKVFLVGETPNSKDCGGWTRSVHWLGEKMLHSGLMDTMWLIFI